MKYMSHTEKCKVRVGEEMNKYKILVVNSCEDLPRL
jgi:hypothetical protein